MMNDDMISRQNVLRCLTDISYNHCKTQGEADVIDTAKTMVAVMSSAQPEIIRCRDCRKYRKFDCPMGITVFDAPDPDGYCYKAERRTDVTD